MTREGYMLVKWQVPQLNADAVENYIIVYESATAGQKQVVVVSTVMLKC